MLTKLLPAAVLAAAAVTLTAVAAAGPVPARQRVAIKVRNGDSFVLTPLTPGTLQRDTGIATFCCWSSRRIVRDGEAIEINDPRMTLTGKRGTLVSRNRIEWTDVADGWSVFTGTWNVIRGTGDYAGLSGGGRGAGIKLPNNMRSQFEGFLAPS